MFYFLLAGAVLIGIWFHMTVMGGYSYRRCTLAAGCALALYTPASLALYLVKQHDLALPGWLYTLLVLANVMFIGMALISLFRKHVLKHHCPWDKHPEN